MLNVFEPNNALLKKYVDSIYIFERGQKEVKYTSYPSANTAVALLRNTSFEFSGNCFYLKNTEKANHFSIAFNRLFRPVNIHYLDMVDEISINFKSFGFAAFAQWKYHDDTDCFIFTAWDHLIKDLFNAVFATPDSTERLKIIEAFLLSRYSHIDDEEILEIAVKLLSDPENEFKIHEIAKHAGVHYKYLYRSFMQYIGCSPIHYRKIVKFRNSIFSKLNKGDAARFIEICYNGNYTDQSYFIKQFHQITGEKPKKFFRDLSSFGENKVVLRFY